MNHARNKDKCHNRHSKFSWLFYRVKDETSDKATSALTCKESVGLNDRPTDGPEEVTANGQIKEWNEGIAEEVINGTTNGTTSDEGMAKSEW